MITATASGDGEALLTELKRLGLQNAERFGSLVSGLFPVAAIDKAVALESLRSISASPRPVTNVGSVTTQGDVALRADIARSIHGVDGAGVKVGVLSDSFNALGGAAADVASGDLPSGITVLEEYSLCGVLVVCLDEGRAMMQIIHDVAPGADLLFHTVFSSVVHFANAIGDLAAAGSDVIVDDVLYLNEPMFQDGVVAQAVDSAVAGGVAYFSAAGNQADDSYESSFDGSGEDLCIDFIPDGFCDPVFELVGEMHDFDSGPGVDVYQSITVPVGAILSVAFQWDEPWGNVNTGDGPKLDHDILLLDSTGNIAIVFDATSDNIATGEAWEVLQYFNDGTYGTSFNLVITLDYVDSGTNTGAGLMKYLVFGSGITVNEHMTGGSTLIGHANAAGAEAVGAAFYLDTPEFGLAPPLLEPYSSVGGTPILFDVNGDPLSPVVRQKPEIVAVDGVNTTFFFSDSHGNDGVPDFFGTSAAAPHAAGVAALMRQAVPGATPADINAALESTAIDMAAIGFDFDSGHGLVQADAAIDALLSGAGGSPPANSPPVASFSWTCAGTSCNLVDESTDSGGSIMGQNWDFGDGSSSSTQSPTHLYASPGNYLVTLTVTDDHGEADAISVTVQVKKKSDTSGSSSDSDDGGGGDAGTGGRGSEKGVKKCSDGIDNDGDGFIDGADPGC